MSMSYTRYFMRSVCEDTESILVRIEMCCSLVAQLTVLAYK